MYFQIHGGTRACYSSKIIFFRYFSILYAEYLPFFEKGIELCVTSMLLGEISVLECAPQYAYGEKGILGLIPNNASLLIEIELLSWKKKV